MPQLQINQGPQDALLYDNTRSYFTNVGYVRTSNFQIEYRDVHSQNTCQLGTTCQFVIPKAADMLGPVDLVVKLNAIDANKQLGISSTNSTDFRGFIQWVDELGYAMIEKCTFSVGSNDIETLTGEQMQIRNELMTSDEMRCGYAHTLKTGRRAILTKAHGGDIDDHERPDAPNAFNRLIALAEKDAGNGTNGATGAPTAPTNVSGERKLIIPLAFFFCKHVSNYFPLAAIAGCNDIRVSVKFRALNELIQFYSSVTGISMSLTEGDFAGGRAIDSSKSGLRCHYVHVTGPEAQTLMSKEHVRLMKLYQTNTVTRALNGDVDIDLSMLHPVTTLIITIRKLSDITTTQTTADHTDVPSLAKSAEKNFFAYYGDGHNPNYDEYFNASGVAATGTAGKGAASGAPFPKLLAMKLELNGQERHPSLGDGLEVDFIKARLMPSLHSNSNQVDKQIAATATDDQGDGSVLAIKQRYELQGSKNIFVYPFALNPEGGNPSGAVNFSKVSHARLTLKFDKAFTDSTNYQIDVHGLYYNWLQIKDGRALLSFA